MWLKSLYEWKNQGIPCAIVTVIKAEGAVPRGLGSKMVVTAGNDIAGSVGGGPVEHISRAEALKAIRDNRCLTLDFSLKGEEWQVTQDKTVQGLCGGTVTVFIEPVLPCKELVIFGGGHIGEKLGRFCDILNLPYRIYDNRPEYATVERFPCATERICQPYEELGQAITLTHISYCVILTHGHAYDEVCLEQILGNKDVPYIGMIGSPNKIKVTLDHIRSRGGVIDDRLYSPVGVRIGRNLPEEIAFSIMTEVMVLMSGGELEHFRVKWWEQ
jgi:xanthine dehydrogenase accessory factor